MAEATGDCIRFLGTAGARFVMIKQQRSSGGVLYSIDGFQLLVDPGPGSLVRCLANQPALDPSTFDALLLTHGHLDHAGDANVMIEAMTNGGFGPRGTLFAPAEALEGDPMVRHYVRRYLSRVEVMGEGRSWALTPGLSLTTPVRLRHSTETYGFCLDYGGRRLSHISDTVYFAELAGHFAPCDVLVLHVVLYEVDEERKKRILHLDVADATRIIGEVRPRVAIITHFGTHVLQAGPAEIAARMADQTGIEVIAATDGMIFDLGKEDTRWPRQPLTTPSS